MFGVRFFCSDFQHRWMHLAAGDRQTAQRAGVVFFRFQNVQHALAHHRHRADVGYLVTLDGPEHFLGIEALVQNHRPAVVNNAQGKRPAGVEINRRGENRLVVGTEPLFDGVIDAMKDKGPLGCQATFGETRRTRSKQNCKRIVFADLEHPARRRFGRRASRCNSSRPKAKSL